MEFNYEELLELTNKDFADVVQERLEDQKLIREVMNYIVQVDRHGISEDEIIDPESDSPTVIVEYLVGWNGKAQALWTHCFDTYSGHHDCTVINSDQVARFNAMRDGAIGLTEAG